MGLQKLDSLIGKDLSNFRVIWMTEVFTIDDVNKNKVASIGFFANAYLAKVFIESQNATFYGNSQALVLTNGEIGFELDQKNSINLVSDEAATLEIKNKALEKLSAGEKQILKLL